MSEKNSVDANYRFIAAYNEVNTRIAQRQQALTLYTSLILSLLAALVAFRSASNNETPIEWLLPGFPIASLSYVFLSYKGERAISNLRRFLSELEQLNGAHHELPSYNTHPQWALVANKARRFQDFAAMLLVISGNALGIGAAFQIYPERILASPWVLGESVALSLISVVLLYASSRSRYSPSALN